MNKWIRVKHGQSEWNNMYQPEDPKISSTVRWLIWGFRWCCTIVTVSWLVQWTKFLVQHDKHSMLKSIEYWNREINFKITDCYSPKLIDDHDEKLFTILNLPEISLTGQTRHAIVQSSDCVQRQESNKPHRQRNGEHSDKGSRTISTRSLYTSILIRQSGNGDRALELHQKSPRWTKPQKGRDKLQQEGGIVQKRR